MRARVFWIAVFLAFLLGVGPPVRAATNRVLGGVGGIDNGTITGGDGTGASAFTINPVRLALVKQARDPGGTVLPDGADVASGNDIYFVLIVDNPTDAPASDIRLLDPVNESQFTYIAGSLETVSVPTGSNDAAIWAGSWSALSDDQDGDIGSVLDSAPADGNRESVSVGAEPGQPNAPLSIPSGTLQAFRFRVRVN